MNNCAATPLRDPVRCMCCGRYAKMFTTTQYTSGLGISFIHKLCEADMLKAGRIYKTWYGSRIIDPRLNRRK